MLYEDAGIFSSTLSLATMRTSVSGFFDSVHLSEVQQEVVCRAFRILIAVSVHTDESADTVPQRGQAVGRTGYIPGIRVIIMPGAVYVHEVPFGVVSPDEAVSLEASDYPIRFKSDLRHIAWYRSGGIMVSGIVLLTPFDVVLIHQHVAPFLEARLRKPEERKG